MAVLVVIVAVIVILLLYLTHQHRPVPGPGWSLPLVGHRRLVVGLARRLGGMDKAFLRLSEIYKSDIIGLRLNGDYTVIIHGVKALRLVYTRPELQGRPSNFFITLRSMGTNKGITMTDGPLWTEQRAFLVKQLSEVGFGRSQMNNLIQQELETLLTEVGNGGPSVDISAHLARRVVRIVWRLVASEDVAATAQLPALVALMRRRAAAFDMAGGVLTQLPWLRYIAPKRSGYSLIEEINRNLKDLIQDTIARHKLNYKEGVTNDFIDAFLHEMNKNKDNSTFTEDQLLMVCVDLLIGGIQTTGHTLEFCVLRMIHHPEVQAKARAELDSVLGDRLPTSDDKSRLPYIQAIISECMRINNVTPVTGPRRATEDVVMDKHTIPKGATVLMNMTSINMDQNLWKDPNQFRPERFLEARDNEAHESFFPFSSGKRRCPGEALAKNFLLVVLAGLLHRYELSPPVGQPMPSLQARPGITLTPVPYTVSIKKRII